MNIKCKRGLAVAAAALQVPMLALWMMVYNAVKADCHTLETNKDGGFILVFDASKVVGALLVYSPVILPLIACMVLSIVGLVWVLKGKHTAGLASVFLYGGMILACGLLAYGFSQPAAVVDAGQYINNLLLSEFMFYRYPFGMDIRYPVIDIFPLLQAVKYILTGALAAVSGILCVGGIVEYRKRRPASSHKPD